MPLNLNEKNEAYIFKTSSLILHKLEAKFEKPDLLRILCHLKVSIHGGIKISCGSCSYVQSNIFLYNCISVT